MHYRKSTLWLAMAMATTTPVHADQRLSDLQVTANRLSQSQADVLASTTVIDRDEIERLQADSVVELLQGRAGIELARSGTRGNQTSLFMRGTNSDHALVLVDGVRIASATDGSINWEFLPVTAIERIEIVRGPRAAAYGADAIGGVINVLTRRAEQDGQQATLDLRTGQQGSSRQSAWFSSVERGTRLSALIDNESTNGFSARANGSDDDGFDQTTGKIAVEHAFADRADLRVSLMRSKTDYDYDDCGYPYSADCRGEGTQQVASASLDTHLSRDWDMVLTAAQSRESREQFVEGAASGETSTRRNAFSVTHQFRTEAGSAALGVDYRDESLTSPDDYARDSRDNWGMFGNWQAQYGRHALSAGLRYDDDEFFGDYTTGSLAYAYTLTASQEIGASYGTAFNAPSFLDLYGPYGANPDLDAEESRTAELFWRLRRDRWHLEVAAFDTHVDELIDYDPLTYIPYNTGEARIRGVELTGGWRSAHWLLSASLTHQDPEDRDTGERLARRARTFGRLAADYHLADWRFGATLRSASDRSDIEIAYPYGDTTVGGYGVVDLRAAWQVTPKIELSAEVENLFDRDYQLVNGYNTRDRYVEGGITLRL
ncbi:TonB-dependent receptor domain-containing protein [Halomonas shantousis]